MGEPADPSRLGPSGSAGRAGAAEPEQLDSVLHLTEPVAPGHIARPPLELALAYLLDPPAVAAGQVVVVAAAAQQKGLLAGVSADRVGLPGLGQPLQVAVDGREPDTVEAPVELLGGHGGVAAPEGLDDRLALFGASLHRLR